MFSSFGQGAVASLGDCVVLDEELRAADAGPALRAYSRRQVAEGGAASDLNLKGILLYTPFLRTVYLLLAAVRKLLFGVTPMFARINDVGISYVNLAQENRAWIALSRLVYRLLYKRRYTSA